MKGNMEHEFSEAEIQALIAMVELIEPVETPNNASSCFFPKSLEEAARYFLSLRLDWGPAFSSLVSKGIIELEQELGIDIFARHGKRMKAVTEPGQQVLKTIDISPTVPLFLRISLALVPHLVSWYLKSYVLATV